MLPVSHFLTFGYLPCHCIDCWWEPQVPWMQVCRLCCLVQHHYHGTRCKHQSLQSGRVRPHWAAGWTVWYRGGWYAGSALQSVTIRYCMKAEAMRSNSFIFYPLYSFDVVSITNQDGEFSIFNGRQFARWDMLNISWPAGHIWPAGHERVNTEMRQFSKNVKVT